MLCLLFWMNEWIELPPLWKICEEWNVVWVLLICCYLNSNWLLWIILGFHCPSIFGWEFEFMNRRLKRICTMICNLPVLCVWWGIIRIWWDSWILPQSQYGFQNQKRRKSMFRFSLRFHSGLGGILIVTFVSSSLPRPKKWI